MRAGEDNMESTDIPTAAEGSADRKVADSVRHTPGPWVAQCCTLAEAKADGDFEWMSMGDGMCCRPPSFRVGTVWAQAPDGATTGLPGSIETTEANARLIAASPDLLAALQRYVDHFGDPLKCAREAIRKATGAQA